MLVQTLVISVFSPQIDFLILYTRKKVEQRHDRGWCSCFGGKRKTKQKSMLKYVELYSGPEYEIFFKYSFILKLVFFSFMYGLAMPIVFPITLVALLNQYIFEKFAIAYFYKKPPSYD